VAVAIPFDTLDYARKLETAGVPAAQAELQATALGDALAKAVAAPGDLVGLESRLVSSIESLDTKLSVKIDSLEAKMSARIDSLDAKIETVRNELSSRIETVRTELITKVDTVKNELRLELGGQIERLAGTVDSMKWMFGFVAVMNIGILIRLFTMR
jgi:tetrahydromethanopterin S-methyltransferase subunit G